MSDTRAHLAMAPGGAPTPQFSHFTLSQKQIGRNRLRQVA